jgi:hypothetical protein
MVDWAAARAFTEEACATIFDVTACRAVAMKDGLSGNHPRQADPNRPAFDFLGTIDLQPPSDVLRRHEPSDPAAGSKAVSYDAVLSARVTDWPWRLQRLDIVEVGADRWRVEASEKDGSDRPAYYLMRARNVVS